MYAKGQGVTRDLKEARERLENAMAEGVPTPMNDELLRAAKNGDRDMVALCLLGGSDVETTDAKGRRPLHWAAAAGREDVVKLLLEAGAGVNARSTEGKTPLDYAESTEITDLLKAAGGKPGREL